METKHTPGPWTQDGNEVYAKTNRFGDIVCSVNPSDASGNPMDTIFDDGEVDEAIANAKLIAASPDLLEALTLVYELLNVGQPLGNDDLDIVHAAIQKATA